MRKSRRPQKSLRQARLDELFIRAEKEEERGRLRSAFRLYLAGAKGGDRGCQLNIGNYYDDAKGIRRNRRAALYWYRRAYRRGDSAAAHNIGILWRNDGYPRRALKWFHRAVAIGDDGANLEIAKYYLQIDPNADKAIHYLEIVCKSDWVSEADVEEAQKLLKQARKRQKLRR